METNRRLKTQNVAMIVCFTALYTYFSFIPAFPIFGLQGGTITLTAIIAPVIGMILGPYVGTLSTFLGGLVALFFAPSFFFPSFASGILATVFTGMLYTKKRGICIFIYFSLLFFFGFYPFVGPVWLYPYFLWFQIFGFLVLISPIQSIALNNTRNSRNDSRFFFTFFISFLTSTLAGQIAGSLVFELISWPIFMQNTSHWAGIWQILAWIYPIERIIIASGATVLGVFLYRVLVHGNLMPFFNGLEDYESS